MTAPNPHLIYLLLTLPLLVAAAPETTNSFASPGPHQVISLHTTLTDPTRNNRDIPLLICYPKEIASAPHPLPIIIFSHGLGGTCDTYTAYGNHWASHGFIVIFPQHHGSDSAVIGHGMMDMLMGKNDLQAFLDRNADISFLIDQLLPLNNAQYQAFNNDPALTPLAHHLDLHYIGISGHSFGAITTQAIAGQTFSAAGNTKTFTDHRVAAAIAMSPSTSISHVNPDIAFGTIKIPIFYMTGTKDSIGLVKASQRRIPFDHTTSESYLLTLEAATHMTFVPRKAMFREANVDTESIILAATTAFWEAYLRNDADAQKYLTHQFPADLATRGTFEQKVPRL